MHYYLIAGETSGDQLGAGLMQALQSISASIFHGVGGPLMRAQGLQSLFPMEEISLIGFAEVLPHVFRIKRRIRQVVADIEARKPAVVITIDSPGFVYRVVAALRARGYTHSQFVHYVAPTVWAYKPERAAKTAKLFDRLLTLFAFEVPYFAREGLDTVWVGHPAAWRDFPPPAPEPGRLAVFPGSRKSELKRHLPLLRDTMERLQHDIPGLTVEMPLPLALHTRAEAMTQHWPCPLTITDAKERQNALAKAQVALVKSGTMTLETALSHTPMLVFYKANPVSAWLIRRMIQTQYVALPNILLEQEIVPELIQERATPAAIAQATRQLLKDASAQNRQREAFDHLKDLLLPDHALSPSMHAASAVIQAARRAATSSS